jgi:hypothetical protein
MPDTNGAARPEDRADNPDHFLVGKLPPGHRLPTDGGPIYKETPAVEVLLGPNPPAVAEPYNAVTAAFFILISAVWAGRVLRAGVEKHPFVAGMLPILLVGGIGGTLYHAFRTRFVYFLLDVLPISLLGLAGAIYLLVRVGKRAGWRRLAAYGAGAVAVYLFLNGVIFRGLLRGALAGNPQLAVNLSYASLAVVLLVPLGFVLARTRFRHAALVLAALASFAVAWFCRLVDGTGLADLPMGTHWLWHTFGAVTTALVIEYFFRLEREEV